MAYGVVLGQTSDSSKDFPIGGIIIWSGQANAIPENWHLCDGTSGTPDLRNRFVVGAGIEYNVGDTGGAKEITLTVEQMPKHSHSINSSSNEAQVTFKNSRGTTVKPFITDMVNSFSGNDSGLLFLSSKNYSYEAKVTSGGLSTAIIDDSGNSQSHENRPPYYALCYIMKIK